jgi:hypothetical protein
MLSEKKTQAIPNFQLPLKLRRQCQETAPSKCMNVDGLTLGQEIGWMT